MSDFRRIDQASEEQNVQRIKQLVSGSCLRVKNPVPCWPTNVDCTNDAGYTPLMMATIHGREVSVATLVDLKADANFHAV